MGIIINHYKDQPVWWKVRVFFSVALLICSKLLNGRDKTECLEEIGEVPEKKHMKRHAWDTWAVKTEKDNLDGLGHEMDGLLPYLGPIWESLETSQYQWKVTLSFELFVHGSGAEHNCGWSKNGRLSMIPSCCLNIDLINPTWVITFICVDMGGVFTLIFSESSPNSTTWSGLCLHHIDEICPEYLYLSTWINLIVPED